MSTYYNYYFRASLSDPSLTSAADVMAAAEAAETRLPLDLDPDHASRPSFGERASYEGPEFDCRGVVVADGVLSVGIFDVNLERDAWDAPDDVRSASGTTRLDVLLAFLGRITTGVPGEIQGCFASEHHEHGHAYPIVRCSDGLPRVLRTSPRPTDEWGFMPDPEVTILDRIPSDMVAGPFDGSFLAVDEDRLIERLRPIETTRVEIRPLALR